MIARLLVLVGGDGARRRGLGDRHRAQLQRRRPGCRSSPRLALIGLIYGAIGALAGAVLDKLAATYLILFLVMTDLGIVQNPMFHDTPGGSAVLLPGYGPSRVMYRRRLLAHLPRRRRAALSLAWLGVWASRSCLSCAARFERIDDAFGAPRSRATETSRLVIVAHVTSKKIT